MSEKRKIILEDRPLQNNTEKDNNYFTCLGIDEVKANQFLDKALGSRGDGEINVVIKNSKKRSDITKYIYENYSKLEMSLLIDAIMCSTQRQMERSSDPESLMSSVINNMLKIK